MLLHRAGAQRVPQSHTAVPVGSPATAHNGSGPLHRAEGRPAPLRERLLRRLLIVALIFALPAAVGYRSFFGPPSWDVADLDPADPVNAEAIAIGHELGKYFGHDPPEDRWWLYPRVAGILLVVRGNGRIDPVRYHPFRDWYWRYRKQVTYAVLDALAAGSRAGTVKAGTILHFGLEDSDVFVHQVEEGTTSPIARSVLKLTHEHPNLFWLHWNPSVVDKARGTIGPRVVPIPHYEALYGLDSFFGTVLRYMGLPSPVPPLRKQAEFEPPRSSLAASAKPWRQRDAMVAWRGATTGLFGDYRQSDRYRVVDAFLRYERGVEAKLRESSALEREPPAATGAEKKRAAVHFPPGVAMADVKFMGTCQHVTEADLPAGFMGGRMSPAQMMSARVVLDIDGNANAWESLRWKLLAGAAVVKVDPRRYIQWYYPLLRHGRDVWVVPVPQPLDGAAAQAVRDSVNLAAGNTGTADSSVLHGDTSAEAVEAVGEVLARNAEAFARAHLTAPRALAAFYDILADLEPYRDGTRSWTIQLQDAA